MLTLYRLLGYALFPLVLPLLLLHPKLRGRLGQRLGFYPDVPGAGPRLWVHAASAGDVKAVSPLLLALRARRPDAIIVLTVTTSTGRAMAQREGVPANIVLTAPIDLFGATRRAMARVRPDLLVLEYAELWPNLVFAARARGARVALTDGRVSPRGLSRARLVRPLYRRLLAELSVCLMRSVGDAERVEALGAPRGRIAVTGNTKYDAPVPGDAEVAALRRAMALDERPLLVLGNTHAGEEAALLPVFARLRRDFPSLRCLVAPRYPERCADVAEVALALGLRVARRSAGFVGDADVVLLDTVGELAAAYGLGVAAFVGGSFTTRGGQNVLEPALHGVPVFFGPSTENFREEVALLADHGGQEVADPEELEGELRAVLEDPSRRRALGALAAERAHSLRGAAEENASRLIALLSASAGLEPRA